MTVHVVGAGIAGLAAALQLALAGRAVRLYEATAVAGGRCRSFKDPQLGTTLDSGIHLTLGWQRHLRRYLQDAGAPTLQRLPLQECGFVDCAGEGRSWRLRPSPSPLWLLDPARRMPGTDWRDLATAARFGLAPPWASVADTVPRRDAAWRSFWEPFCVAALNTPPDHAAAHLLGPFLRQMMLGGAAGRDLWIAPGDLDACFVAPALARLAALGVAPAWRQRLLRLEILGDRVAALRFSNHHVTLAVGEAVVLALPPRATAALLPSIPLLPDSGIVVAHFRLPEPGQLRLFTLLAEQPAWLLTRGSLATVTLGAANGLLGWPTRDISERLWRSARKALGPTSEAPPPARVLKFRHGTYLHSPAAELAKPKSTVGLVNLRLAGDWTLPRRAASLDAAAQSGQLAAAALW